MLIFIKISIVFFGLTNPSFNNKKQCSIDPIIKLLDHATPLFKKKKIRNKISTNNNHTKKFDTEKI